jgi:two-component system, OmpR family, response regulator ChvI
MTYKLSDSGKRRLLIVDDDPDITTFFKLALDDAGYDVDVFNDAIQALSNFKPNYYDLSLIDIRMPKLNGFELLKRLRKKDTKVKVCFITSFEMYYKSMIEEYPLLKKEIGCFIKKPVTAKNLIERIKKEMETKHRLDFAGICTLPLILSIFTCGTLLSTIN